MVKLTIPDFDIRQIAESGQCFRMNRTEEGGYGLTAFNSYLEIGQSGQEITFSCTDQEFQEVWRHYFDLDEDYGSFKDRADREDGYLQEAISRGQGIRILRQELWETIVSFIISQQNNIPRIKKCTEAVCAEFGEKRYNFRKEPYYTFPGPEELASLPEDGLRPLNLGYRSSYIVKTARMVSEGAVDLDAVAKMDYESARMELKKLCGVGTKVAECICLYSLHHVDAFPVDTHIRSVLERHYPKGFPLERYRGYAGILQQYMFYYELTAFSR